MPPTEPSPRTWPSCPPPTAKSTPMPTIPPTSSSTSPATSPHKGRSSWLFFERPPLGVEFPQTRYNRNKRYKRPGLPSAAGPSHFGEASYQGRMESMDYRQNSHKCSVLCEFWHIVDCLRDAASPIFSINY